MIWTNLKGVLTVLEALESNILAIQTNADIIRGLPDETLEILADKLCSRIEAEKCELQYDCATCLRLYIEDQYH